MTATDERFTPPEIFVPRDRVWRGGADTDPAWHPRSYSRARHCYTKADNGLRLPWFGRVWLNPPWSSVGPWLRRLLEHMRKGDPDAEGMMLVRNDPPTTWFAAAAAHGDAIAFLRGRTRYWQWNARRRRLERCGSPEFSSVIFYFGPNVESFVAEFRRDGHVAVALRDHSKRGTVARMPKRQRRTDLERSLATSIKDALVAHALEHPDLTLGELADALGNGATALMGLRVRDLWPKREAAPRVKNGANGHAKKRRPASSPAPKRASSKRTSPQSAARVAEVRAAIGKLGHGEFVASDIMEALGCSRQTALRALAQIPEVTRSGKNKSAKYVLQKGS